MNWVDLLDPDVGPLVSNAMRAFGRRPLPVNASNAAELLNRFESIACDVGDRLPFILTQEVDASQAQLFCRRYDAVISWLKSIPHEDGVYLALSLVLRVREILVDESPRALRVRAAIDFFSSQGSMLLIQQSGPHSSISDIISELQWTRLPNGLAHSSYSGLSELGPLRINVLAVHTTCGLRAISGRDYQYDSLGNIIRACGGIAGVSGGFFFYSEPNISPPCERGDPVGLLIDRQCVISPPFLTGQRWFNVNPVDLRLSQSASWTACCLYQITLFP